MYIPFSKYLSLKIFYFVTLRENMTEAENYTSPEENPIIECRTCLQILNSDSSFFNIFDGWMPPWEGMENTMAEDLAKLANIEVFINKDFRNVMIFVSLFHSYFVTIMLNTIYIVN